VRSPRPLRPRYDAVVVGARCAGAATALLLARRGLRVLAVERDRPGADTLSTHALMRGGVLQLHRWGLLDAVRAAGTPPVRTTSFHYGDEEVAVPIKARDGVDALYAPRRTVLDAILVEGARKAGAEVVHGVRLVDLFHSRAGRVAGVVVQGPDGEPVRIEAGVVIGADGVRSTVARLAGAETRREGRHATGVVYGYWPLAVEGYHWHYRPGVSVGVIPTNGGLTCVFAAAPERRFREEIRFDLAAGHRRILAEGAPELAAAVAGRSPAGPLRGFAGRKGYLRRSGGPGWALVGDAGYFKDPITAHGITDALRDAELLARAVEEGSDRAFADYEAARDALAGELFEVSDRIASFDWDIAAAKELHLALSEEMRREVAALRTLDGEPAPPERRTA